MVNPPPAPGAVSSATLEQRGPGTGWQLRYWSIFIGQSLSLIGSALTQFVLMWWITDTTGSVSALAMASIFALLPQAVLAPLGGTLADRYSRRLLMIGADAVSALCMAILIWLFLSHQIALWHVHAMLAVRGAMQAFQQPAATASTAMLVPHGFLPRAAGLNQTMAGIVAVAAAPLGALAISLMPIGWALSLDVLTAFLGIVPLCIFAIAQELPSRMRKASLWREFKDGVALVWQDRGLRTLFGLLTVTVLIVMPSYALVPLLVRNHFGGGASDVALLEGLAGFGMIAGGIFVAMLAPKRAMRWIIWGLAISCVLLGVLGLLPGTMFGTAIVIFVLSDISFVLGNVPLMARLQQIVPNHMQGRVLSIMNMLMGLAAPAGLALAMPIGDLVGVNWLFAAAGFLGAAITLLGLLSPALMRLDLR